MGRKIQKHIRIPFEIDSDSVLFAELPLLDSPTAAIKFETTSEPISCKITLKRNFVKLQGIKILKEVAFQ